MTDRLNPRCTHRRPRAAMWPAMGGRRGVGGRYLPCSQTRGGHVRDPACPGRGATPMARPIPEGLIPSRVPQSGSAGPLRSQHPNAVSSGRRRIARRGARNSAGTNSGAARVWDYAAGVVRESDAPHSHHRKRQVLPSLGVYHGGSRVVEGASVSTGVTMPVYQSARVKSVPACRLASETGK